MVITRTPQKAPSRSLNGGDERKALMALKDVLRLSLCSPLEVALLYRWKSVEKANAWVSKGSH